MFKKITFVATEAFILVVFNGQRTQITKAEKPGEFEALRDLLRKGDEEAIIKRVNGNTHIIEEHSSGLFIVDRQNKKIIDKETNTEVGLTLGKRIIQWSEEGLPFEPLLKFHRKVIENPSKESAAELYEFLEKNKIPITAEGNFIGYKKVTTGDKGNLVDSRTGCINNNIGQIVRMSRKDVDPNRRNECSYGLHIGAWDYVSSFSGDTILACEIEPQHVVAVPRDYNAQKMRVCEYKILHKVDSKGKEIEAKMVHVKKEKVGENEISATVTEAIDLRTMTAQQIKDYIKTNYGIDIHTNNKNKQQIIKQAYKIIADIGNDTDKTNSQSTLASQSPSQDNNWEDDEDWEDDEEDDDENW